MHRLYFYLAAFISITTLPVAALAENAVAPTAAQAAHPAPAANDAGFLVDLPAVDADQLIGVVRAYRDSLERREEAITRYLDENGLDTKDAFITVVMPGGLLYAAIRKGNLEQARMELAEITEDMHELSRDLVAMQAMAGKLKVAQLQR